MTKTKWVVYLSPCLCFEFVFFGYWILFVICDLLFVISPIKRDFHLVGS